MAVRHLGELKEKKSYRARAKVEIHESTYVGGVHFSHTPEARTPANLRRVAARTLGAGQLPPPTAARRGRRPSPRGPSLAAGARRPGRSRVPAATSGRAKQTARLPAHLREIPERSMQPPPLAQLHPDGLRDRGEQGRRPRPPAAASRPPAASRTCRGGPWRPRGRPQRSGPGASPLPPRLLTVMLWKTPPAVAAHTYLASQ